MDIKIVTFIFNIMNIISTVFTKEINYQYEKGDGSHENFFWVFMNRFMSFSIVAPFDYYSFVDDILFMLDKLINEEFRGAKSSTKIFNWVELHDVRYSKLTLDINHEKLFMTDIMGTIKGHSWMFNKLMATCGFSLMITDVYKYMEGTERGQFHIVFIMDNNNDVKMLRNEWVKVRRK